MYIVVAVCRAAIVRSCSKTLEHFGENADVSPQAHLDEPRRLPGRGVGRHLHRPGRQPPRSRASSASATPRAFEAAVGVDVRAGLHVPDSQSIMVAEAARLWLESLRGRRARAHHARRLPAARRSAHRPAHRRREALAAFRPDGARVRGCAAQGALAGHGAQGARLARRHPGRRPGARPCRSERRARPARESPRQGSPRRQASGQAQGRRRHPLSRRNPRLHRRASMDVGGRCC